MVRVRETRNRLFARRKALRLTQDQLASMARVSQSYISNLEGRTALHRGAVPRSSLWRLAHALRVTVAYLVGEEDLPSDGQVHRNHATSTTSTSVQAPVLASTPVVQKVMTAQDLDMAMSAHFDAVHHRVGDARAVLDALRDEDIALLGSIATDLQRFNALAETWLDLAAGLRVRGLPITIATMLFAASDSLLTSRSSTCVAATSEA